MFRILLVCLFAVVAARADDAWNKVKEVKTGTELRVYKTGAKQPVAAKFSDATDDHLVIILKNEEKAIPKEEIERIEYRPAGNGNRVRTETRNTTDTPESQPVGPRPNPGANVPGTSSSSTMSMGSKPDFETLYRKPPAHPRAPMK
jgi:hypothetical protein